MGRGGVNMNVRKHGMGDNPRGDGGPPRQIKRQRMQDRGPMNPEQRIFERISNLNMNEIVPKKFEIKKFMANTRLYVGNIASDVAEADVKELFEPYGELDEVFVNREKNFAFLKMDFRTNAEKARAEIDGKNLKGKPLKVRFAPASVRLKVKNLSPAVSNELFELAFSVFGDIERALVFVDDRGKSIGEGIIDFTRKNNAVIAHRFCSERCYFLTSELRPIETELAEMFEMDEGLLEANINSRSGPGNFRRAREDQNLAQSRENGPRVADEGSFEHEYGMKWKALVSEYKQKEQELKNECRMELDELYKKMEMERFEYETDLLRRQLKQREMDSERHRMEWEQRMNNSGPPPGYNNMGGGGGGGRPYGRGGGHGGPGGRGGHGGPPFGDNRIPRNQDPNVQMERPDISMDDVGRDEPPPMTEDGPNANGGSLPPPPMPPSLMDQLAAPGGPEPGQNVTWDCSPAALFNNSPFNNNNGLLGPAPGLGSFNPDMGPNSGPYNYNQDMKMRPKCEGVELIVRCDFLITNQKEGRIRDELARLYPTSIGIEFSDTVRRLIAVHFASFEDALEAFNIRGPEINLNYGQGLVNPPTTPNDFPIDSHGNPIIVKIKRNTSFC